VTTACPWLKRIGDLWRGSEPAFVPLAVEVHRLAQARES
jgi:hypothetical protein